MIKFLFYLILLLLTLFSFGFIDRGLPLTANSQLILFQNYLGYIVYENRIWAGVLYIAVMLGLFFCYFSFLNNKYFINSVFKAPAHFFVPILFILFLSFPAFSYDIFNYMLTAKVTYYYQENPYIVMPIEIPNEPWLSFTRAANKVALYGPAWIAITYIPYIFGNGNIFQTIYAFKLIPLSGYLIILYLIYFVTRNFKNVIFFGLNPLVLIEVLVSAHNDIIMMVLAVSALILISFKYYKSKILGIVCFVLSIFIKGATLMLIPLYLLKKYTKKSSFEIGFWLMLIMFLLSPLREELYPWYAVWFLCFAACIPFNKSNFIHYLSIALTIGLELRHLPYILTREYGGLGPLFRIIISLVPVSLFLIYWGYKYHSRNYFYQWLKRV